MNIVASEAIEIKDTSADAIVPTGIFTNTVFENGDGGNLRIDTPQLILRNGGQLSASSGAVFITRRGLSFIRSGGKGGNIELEIDSLSIEGISADGVFPSSILSDTRSTSSAGNIAIETDDLYLDSDGLISASSFGNGRGGNITIDASNSVNIKGTGNDNLQSLIVTGLIGESNLNNTRGGIAAFTVDSGKAGSIKIDTNRLNLDRGAIISTATYSSDRAGDLTINASEAINVRGSAIISPTFGSGDGGDISLKTKNLSVTRGGTVASASAGSGRAGNIDILATESIAIVDTVPNILFSGSISTGSYRGLGISGDLTIDTQRLSIKNGANIQTNNVFVNLGETDVITEDIDLDVVDPRIQGKLTIDATEFIEISGFADEANEFNQSANSHIYSISDLQNPASNIEINTGKLSIYDRGEISVRSSGSGAAGTLAINADSVSLRNRGNLNGTTVSGQGGNIDLQIQGILEIGDRSEIDTNASQGNGGNIDITADFVIARSRSSIAAKALQNGNGGNINIMANDIFLTADSSVTADSALGIDGTVKVETLVDTEQNNLTRLPQKVIRADRKITRSCSNNGDLQGVFSYTGRGGLPFNPLTNFQTDDVLIADLDIPATELNDPTHLDASSQLELLPPQTVEADRWQVNADGKVELTASNKSNMLDFAFDCPLSKPNA